MNEKLWWACWLSDDEAASWENSGTAKKPVQVLAYVAIDAARAFAEQLFRDNFSGLTERSRWPLDESLCLPIYVQDGERVVVFEVSTEVRVISRAVEVPLPDGRTELGL